LGQLTELRTAQSNQRRLVTDPAVRGSFDARLELIAGQIRELADHCRAADRQRDPPRQKLDAAFYVAVGSYFSARMIEALDSRSAVAP
jgi:transposase